jgi:hypothetical protein
MTYGGVEVQLHGGEWSLCPRGKKARYPLDTRLSGLQSWSDAVEKTRVFFFCSEPNPGRRTCSRSLYQLSYPGSALNLTRIWVIYIWIHFGRVDADPSVSVSLCEGWGPNYSDWLINRCWPSPAVIPGSESQGTHDRILLLWEHSELSDTPATLPFVLAL